MDKCTDQILKFEQALKNKSSNKRTLYAADTNLISINYKVEDVIVSVSKQIKALQSADCVNRQHNINKVKSSGNCLLSNGTLKENILNKFETQCVSDTQLIEIVQIVEAQEADTGIIKEFDTTFCQKNNHIDYSESVFKEKLDNSNKTKCLSSNTVATQNIPPTIDNSSASNEILKNGDSIKPNNYVQGTFEVCKEFSDSEDFQQFQALDDLEKSPIISKINPLIIKTAQSLVYKLDSFEKFEALALPIIEEYPDLKVAKKVINSQIESKELFFETNVDPILKTNKLNTSPILKSSIDIKKHHNNATPIWATSEHKSQQSMIEDEILFSSDEENNHSTNAGEDLPLTCALQTSFYDYTGVLDKTMYVGFQTASNKTIQVHSDSFIKAQSLLNNHELENIDVTELVNMFDNTFKSSNNTNSVGPNNANISLSTNNHSIDKQSLGDNIFVGFQKANGKSIDISENALMKGAELLKDIDTNREMSQSQGSSHYKRKKQLEAHSWNVTKTVKHTKETIKASTCFPNIVITKEDNESQIIRIINDVENTLTKINDDNIIQEFETNLVEKGERNNNALTYPKEYNEMAGIEMANSKVIKVSNKVMGKTKRMFENSPELKNVCNATPITELSGFKTASNKSIAVSEKTLLKYQNILDNIDFTNILEPCQDMENKESGTCAMPTVKGFSTASNKEIIVTNEALLKSKALFEDIVITSDMTVKNDRLNKTHSDMFETFKIANNNIPEVSKEALCRNDKIIDNISEENIRNSSNKVYEPGIKLQGFVTANNKPIMVSSKLIDKYKNIFEDINISESNVINDIEHQNNNNLSEDVTKITNSESKFQLHTSNQKAVDVSKTIGKGKKILRDCYSFQGFQTASHKKISVPKEKLASYLKIFDGIDLNITEMDENLSTKSLSEAEMQYPQLIEPKTVNNENISFSEISKANSNKLMHNIDIGIANKENEYSYSYKHLPETKDTLQSAKYIFQTASSKPISVTEEAFEASQKIINAKTDEDVRNVKNLACVGFKTASKRKIDISKQTLNKAKKFFDGIDETPSNEFKDLEKHTKSKFQFQTANNKRVNVSEEAIVASQKQLNTDLYCKRLQMSDSKNCNISKETMSAIDSINFNEDSKKNIPTLSNMEYIQDSKLSYKINLDRNFKVNGNKDGTQEAYLEQLKDISLNNILDSQIINNFEETLYTEDFLKETSSICKRSGSPILHCPKAKKRRFEAPASVIKNVNPDGCQNNRKATFIFDSNYKKHNVFSLKDLKMFEEKYKSKTIDTQFFGFNFENILEFEFSSERNDWTGVKLSTNNIKEIFEGSVNKKIIPTGWIENHLKLIIWKLLSYEIIYPNVCYKACSMKKVMEQLKYRYDRELYNVQRPAFRKILERDDIPTKTMVVCVVGVYINGVYVSSVANSTDTIELLLTDGWYCIKACIDRLLAKYVCQGKVSVGTKLVIHGAELINCDQGISPWEDTSSVRLRLFGNSTRRARWDARLGYHSNAAILTQLSAVKADGGKVSKLRVFVTRVYPTLYVEKFDDGSMVTRSERLENLHQMKYESERQMLLEKIYEDVEKEFYEQESQDSEGVDVDRRLETGSQISRAMKKHFDPAEFRASLTESQLRNLQNHTNKQKDKQIELIQEKVREKIKNSSLNVTRNVVPLMKIRVASVGDDFKICKGMISIWRPNEELQEIITEGKWIQVYNVVPTALRYSEIQLSASRQSIFQNCEVKNSKKNTIIESLKRRYYPIRDLTKNSFLNTDYNEIDTVGFVFLIEPSNREFETSKQLFQNAFLADENKNIICVNFWGGIKKFGFEHILDTGQIVACINLQKRSGNTIKSIPQYRATEFSYFTKTSKYKCIREVSIELIKNFSGLDKRKFQDDCVVFKNNFASVKHGNDVSPYRMNNSDYNISKNRIFIDSPIAKDANFNLSGIDFESTFKQRDTQDMAPQELLRKEKVNAKIAKLKMYGEPPPLSTINIINGSKNAANAFKSPLTTRNNIQV
ncbi:breast cancer type 2 susceptibility protein-like [Pieris napi]|uniref:breast cancer type 2 susceptibility protein-like n=1 Tax=Pieris napi TaxID=78633 RepID=UPI001FBBF17C|nr:breast cancer type 2 susceptibility protein-like [Pieris napi]